MVRGSNLDYVELSSDTAIVHTMVPERVAGKLNEVELWDRYGVKVIAIKHDDKWNPVLGEVELVTGDQVQIYGDSKRVEKFSRLARK